MGISLLVYSHSSSLDVLHIFLRQLERHLIIDSEALSNIVVLVDEGAVSQVKKLTHLPIEIIEYSEAAGFSKQLLMTDSHLDEYFVYLQDDFFLIDDIRISELEKKVELMQRNNLDLFRLIPSGYRRSKAYLKTFLDSNVVVFDNSCFFRIDHLSSLPACMQATIWKKEIFLEMHEYAQIVNLREEWHENYRSFFKVNRVLGICASFPEFPYITVTAVKRGRWNFLDSEYAYKLMEILKRENVNPLTRGIFVTERKLMEPKGSFLKDCWRRLRYGQ
jgi:hypothetical protein